ncbi:MAG: thiamine pyrophosphate-dependent dehydrogenase E1 component subunit alpha [Dehalococcoidia bacterium]
MAELNQNHRELGLEDRDVLRMYRLMALARTLSGKAWLLNRQGKVFFTMPCDGQEAADVGSAYALRAGIDLLLPYARDLGAILTLGMTSREVMLNLLARAEDPNGGGRQMPMHWGCKRLAIVSMGGTVGITIPKAVGVGLASKLRSEDAVTLVYFGDGATSQGYFHEGLNFAGVLQVPVVFFCNNNGWAASVPFSKQTGGPDTARRAESYGFPGVLVDGTNVLEVYQATRQAVDRARRGGGPTLIEARSLRLMPHSSADDHLLYRTQEELDADRQLDPLPKFRDYLMERGLWRESDDLALWSELEEETEAAIREAEAAPWPNPASAWDRVYAPDPSEGS